jgi:hypothetical protein
LLDEAPQEAAARLLSNGLFKERALSIALNARL